MTTIKPALRQLIVRNLIRVWCDMLVALKIGYISTDDSTTVPRLSQKQEKIHSSLHRCLLSET